MTSLTMGRRKKKERGEIDPQVVQERGKNCDKRDSKTTKEGEEEGKSLSTQ